MSQQNAQPQRNKGPGDSDPVLPSPSTQNKRRRTRKDDPLPGEHFSLVKNHVGGLLEMPYDVLFEIFSRLDPLDHLNLSRNTKELRKFLMNKSMSLGIWRNCISDSDLPPCLADLNEPQYIDLMLGNACQLCSRKSKDMYTQVSARTRACKRCVTDMKGDRWCTLDSISYGMRLPYPWEFSRYTPRLQVASEPDHYGRPYKLWCDIGFFKAWHEKHYEILALENKQESKHWIIAKEIQMWQSKIKEERVYEFWLAKRNAEVMKERKALVVKYIEELGWGEELARMNDHESVPQRPEDSARVVRACQGEITEPVLKRLTNYLETFMKKYKKARLLRGDRGYKDRVLRLSVLRKVFQAFIAKNPTYSVYPNICDLSRIPSVKDELDQGIYGRYNSRFCQKHLKDVVPLLPQIIANWREEMDLRLVDIIRGPDVLSTQKLKTPDERRRLLENGSVVFSCSGCADPDGLRTLVRYPDVLMHPCALAAGAPHDGETLDDRIMREVYQEGYWNTSGAITFEKSSRNDIL